MLQHTFATQQTFASAPQISSVAAAAASPPQAMSPPPVQNQPVHPSAAVAPAWAQKPTSSHIASAAAAAVAPPCGLGAGVSQGQQQPVTVLSAPVALSLVGHPLQSSLPVPPHPAHPSTLALPIPDSFPAQLVSFPHLQQPVFLPSAPPPVQGGAIPHAASGNVVHALPQHLQAAVLPTAGAEVSASRSHPSHTSTSTTESLMRSDVLPLNVSATCTSAPPPQSLPHSYTALRVPQATAVATGASVPNRIFSLQSAFGAAADQTAIEPPTATAAGVTAARSPAATQHAHALRTHLVTLAHSSMPAGAGTVSAAAPAVQQVKVSSAQGGQLQGGANAAVAGAQAQPGISGVLQAVMELNVTAPSTSLEVSLLLALQKRLDVVQQRLDTEQTRSGERLDKLVQSMLVCSLALRLCASNSLYQNINRA